MRRIIDNEFMELLQKTKFDLLVQASGSYSGSRKSKSKGSSVEFSDYREYMPGDDFRRLDWNALARFNKAFIKLFMEEREASITIFLDTSKSMDYGNIPKSVLAARIAAAFSYAALSAYDVVTIVPFGMNDNLFIERVRGKQSFNLVVDTLEDMVFDGENNLLETVDRWQSKFRQGLSIIVSDFLYDHQLDDVLKRLAFSRQKTIVCQVLAKEEIKPDIDKNVRLVDSETKQYIELQSYIDSINVYLKSLKQHISGIKKSCSVFQSDYILVNTEHGMKEVLGKLAAERI